MTGKSDIQKSNNLNKLRNMVWIVVGVVFIIVMIQVCLLVLEIRKYFP